MHGHPKISQFNPSKVGLNVGYDIQTYELAQHHTQMGLIKKGSVPPTELHQLMGQRGVCPKLT
jgi:hypothetical protein